MQERSTRLLLEDVSFVALVGALGMAPYLFSKSADLVPKALRAIATEYLSIARDNWLWSKSSSGSSSTVVELLARRRRGIISTVRASLSLLVSFAVLSVALTWAGFIVSPSSVHATISVNGEVITESVAEGSEININCTDGSLRFEILANSRVARGRPD